MNVRARAAAEKADPGVFGGLLADRDNEPVQMSSDGGAVIERCQQPQRSDQAAHGLQRFRRGSRSLAGNLSGGTALRRIGRIEPQLREKASDIGPRRGEHADKFAKNAVTGTGHAAPIFRRRDRRGDCRGASSAARASPVHDRVPRRPVHREGTRPLPADRRLRFAPAAARFTARRQTVRAVPIHLGDGRIRSPGPMIRWPSPPNRECLPAPCQTVSARWSMPNQVTAQSRDALFTPSPAR